MKGKSLSVYPNSILVDFPFFLIPLLAEVGIALKLCEFQSSCAASGQTFFSIRLSFQKVN